MRGGWYVWLGVGDIHVLGVIISVDDDDVVYVIYVDVVMLLVIDDIVVNGDLHEVCVDVDHMSDVSD